MPITAHRAMLSAAGAAVFASAPAPALAQADPRTVLNIMVECSKIDDVMTRVSCYDNNIRGFGGTAATAPPPQSAIPQPRSAPVATGAAGMERERDRAPRPPAALTGESARSRAVVTAVAERGPGAYLLTLQDGAQWEFSEDMPPSYHVPSPGSTVEIERGTLGSYRMRFDGQQPVRVRRVR